MILLICRAVRAAGVRCRARQGPCLGGKTRDNPRNFVNFSFSKVPKCVENVRQNLFSDAKSVHSDIVAATRVVKPVFGSQQTSLWSCEPG